MLDASARLKLIADELKAAGESGIRRGVMATVRAEAQPLKSAVQSAALAKIPHSGGLAAREAATVKVQILTSARSAGVRLRNTRVGSAQTDKGFVRHPTFGRKGKGQWVTQSTPQSRGWWTETLARKGPQVAAALNATIIRLSVRIRGI